ncbi:MAG: prolyl oligopeptidase family serine peptidase [Deltaproteobacteria bacterium]|nr:prolyl oligopeptidase family serine peptidase [Deltaproteobacteria bacterium]
MTRTFETEEFQLHSEGLRLPVSVAVPCRSGGPFPSVQIHHGGGGFEPIYASMAAWLAERGTVGITLIHRGYPGADGEMEYGKGEVVDIGNLADEMRRRSYVDPARMGIMGYSRGAHNALLALERFHCFRAGALWSPPTDMVDHVSVNPWIAEIVGGAPVEVPEEYRIRSSILRTEEISCPLLLIHGERDEVIPVRHTLRLAEALRRQGKPHELRLFPEEGHVWTPEGFSRNWRLTVSFFEAQLGHGTGASAED